VLLAAQTASAQSGYPTGRENPGWFHTRHGAKILAARILADRFFGSLGTPFVSRIFPAPASNIATDRVAKAAADATCC